MRRPDEPTDDDFMENTGPGPKSGFAISAFEVNDIPMPPVRLPRKDIGTIASPEMSEESRETDKVDSDE